jgi:hypothetical protein
MGSNSLSLSEHSADLANTISLISQYIAHHAKPTD